MDKVQKIRKEVEKLKSQLLRGACSSQVAMETRCKEEAYNELLAILESLREEPVGSIWHNEKESHDETKLMLVIAIDKTIHLWQGKFDTLEMRSAFCLCAATDISGKTYSIVSKWAYIDDLLKL